MTKRRVALIVMISALMFGVGCGDDDDDGTTPPPGAGSCAGCPCNFFDVAMTEDCWIFPPDHPSNFGVGTVGQNYICSLTKPPPGLTTVSYEGPTAACTDSCIQPACHIISSPPCSRGQVSISMRLQGQAQVDACRACLEHYVEELSQILPINAPGGLTCPANP
jgi:hypothetical protein